MFASSTGSVIEQRFHEMDVRGDIRGVSPSQQTRVQWDIPWIPIEGGYEIVLKADLQNLYASYAAEMMRTADDNTKTVDPGKYELITSFRARSSLLPATRADEALKSLQTADPAPES